LLTSLLRDVSRSFYLTLRVLPSAVRPQISLAYLLARTADTIADTAIVPVTQRLEALARLKARILGERSTPGGLATDLFRGAATTGLNAADLRESLPSAASRAEHILLEKIEEMLAVLATFTPLDQQLVRETLATITSGQELDLQRFELARAGRGDAVIALQTQAELDDYTHRVAGCVGEFWTKLCRRHLFPQARLDDVSLLADGVRFGRGLQLVNILRDLPLDVRRGRCYLPQDRLATCGLAPGALRHRENEPKLRPLYDAYLSEARNHLAAGWAYTNRLPRGQVRVRLACAWPILIGVQTLDKLAASPVLNADRRVKISRVEVRQIMLHTLACCPFPGAWAKLFRKGSAGKKSLV
jgi:farnesyl-diphosphate farnesyltransferase